MELEEKVKKLIEQGDNEIISSIPLDMFSIRDMEVKIKDNIKEIRKDIKDIEGIIILNIIKLER